MSTYREKFLESEKQANKLVERLTSLKEETSNYRDAGKSLAQTQEQISNLITEVDLVIKEQREMIGVLNEISAQEIIEAIDSSQISINAEITMIQEQNKKLNAQINRLLIISLFSLGLIIIIGILVFVV